MSVRNSIKLPFLVDRALKYSEIEKDEIEKEDSLWGLPKLVLVGVGNAGNNTINRVETMGKTEGLETIAINTDKSHLDVIHADIRVPIGSSLTKGSGSIGKPEIGREAAELSRHTIETFLEDKDIVFITAGMGGGTGTGASSIIADIAKEQGAGIVIGIVSLPFRADRLKIVAAIKGIEMLRKYTDIVILLDNEKLIELNLTVNDTFAVIDQVIAEIVIGISETLTQPSLVNIDFADIKAVLGLEGFAMALVGEKSIEDAIYHPLLEADYTVAKGAFIHVRGGSDITLKEIDEIVELLTNTLDSNAKVIWGARIIEEYMGDITVTAILTGLPWKTLEDLINV